MKTAHCQNIAIILSASFFIFIWIPFSTYLNNIYDFDVPIQGLVLPFLGAFTIISTFFSIAYLLLGKYGKIVPISGVCLIIYGYIMIHATGPYHYILMGHGSWKQFSQEDRYILLLILTLVALSYILWKKWKTALPLLSSGFTLFFSVMFVITSYDYYSKKSYISTHIGHGYDIGLLSSKENVLLFLLDEVENDILAEVIRESPEFQKSFSEFTFYNNLISNFGSTIPSLYSIFNGNLFDNQTSYFDHVQSNTEFNNHIFKIFTDNGYQSSLYGFHSHTMRFDSDYIHNSIPIIYPYREKTARLVEVSAILLLPTFWKSYFYDNGIWKLSSRNKETISYRSHNKNTEGYDLYKQVRNNKPGIGDRDTFTTRLLLENMRIYWDVPIFKAYYFKGAHSPFNLTKEGKIREPIVSRESYKEKLYYKLTLLLKIIEKIKYLGIWDSSTIIVTSDHGAARGEDFKKISVPGDHLNTYTAKYLAQKRLAASLMIKKPHNGSQKEMTFNTRPTSLVELKDIAIAAAKNSSPPLHRALRRGITYNWFPKTDHFLNNFSEFIVKEKIHDNTSWIFYHTHEKGQPANCLFTGGKEIDILYELFQPEVETTQKNFSFKFDLPSEIDKEHNLFADIIFEFSSDPCKNCQFKVDVEDNTKKYSKTLTHPPFGSGTYSLVVPLRGQVNSSFIKIHSPSTTNRFKLEKVTVIGQKDKYISKSSNDKRFVN